MVQLKNKIASEPNPSIHQTSIPLCFIEAGDFGTIHFLTSKFLPKEISIDDPNCENCGFRAKYAVEAVRPVGQRI